MIDNIFLAPTVVQYKKTYKPVVIGELDQETWRIIKALANFQADIEKTYDPENLRPKLFAQFVDAVIERYGPLPRDPLPVLKQAWGELGSQTLRAALPLESSTGT